MKRLTLWLLIVREGNDVRVKKPLASVLLLLLLISYTTVLASLFFVKSARASNTPTMTVLDSSNVREVGQSFSVDVHLGDPEDELGWVWGVNTWELTLGYDSDILYTDKDAITEGDFLKTGGTTSFFKTVGSGWLTISCFLTDVTAATSSNGILTTITFTVASTGKSILDLYDTKLEGPYPDYTPIDHITVDGEFHTTRPRASFYYLPSRAPGDMEFSPDPSLQRDPVLGETLTFNASAFVSGGKYKGSYDPDGYIVNYQWSFGDGNTTTVTNPIITHVYTENKTYTVTLTITDNATKTNSYNRPDVLVQKRDVAITNIWVNPTAQSPGEKVSIKVTIKNLGSANEYVNVTAYYRYDTTDTLIWYNQTEHKPAFSTPQEIDPEMKTPPLLFKPGKSIVVNYTWTTPTLSEGEPFRECTIWANISMVDQSGSKFILDLYLKELDCNTTNNMLWNGKVKIIPLHNLEIYDADITLSPTLKAPTFDTDRKQVTPAIIKYGIFQVSINVTVSNTGDFDETFYVTLYQDFTLLHNWTDISLAKKTSTTLNYTWSTAGLSIGNYTIKAQASEVPGESEMNRTGDNQGTLNVTITTNPVASFTYTPYPKPVAGELVRFNATASYATAGWTIVSYRWTTNGTGPPPSSEPTYERIFSAGGVFNVSLRVTDSVGLTGTTFQLINVRERPIAFFTFTPESPKADQPITFDASLSNPKIGSIVSYVWGFGDTNITATNNPIIVHSYAKGGNFTITLSVIDSEELTGTRTDTVLVEKLSSIISVEVHPTEVAVGDSTTISGSISPVRSGVKATILHRLGEGQWSHLKNITTDQNGLYTYDWTAPATIGTYQIKATWDGDEKYKGDESNAMTVVVKYSSTISISVNPSPVTIGEKITISGSISPVRPMVVVTIWYRQDEDEWSLLGYKVADQNGFYKYDWTPQSVGTYQVKSTWDGDEQYLGSKSNIMTVEVKEAPTTNVFLYVVGGAVAAIIIVVIAGLYLLKYRKKA